MVQPNAKPGEDDKCRVDGLRMILGPRGFRYGASHHSTGVGRAPVEWPVRQHWPYRNPASSGHSRCTWLSWATYAPSPSSWAWSSASSLPKARRPSLTSASSEEPGDTMFEHSRTIGPPRWPILDSTQRILGYNEGRMGAGPCVSHVQRWMFRAHGRSWAPCL